MMSCRSTEEWVPMSDKVVHLHKITAELTVKRKDAFSFKD